MSFFFFFFLSSKKFFFAVRILLFSFFIRVSNTSKMNLNLTYTRISFKALQSEAKKNDLIFLYCQIFWGTGSVLLNIDHVSCRLTSGIDGKKSNSFMDILSIEQSDMRRHFLL